MLLSRVGRRYWTYVSVSDELEFLGHASDCGGRQVGPVHQGHTVHQADGCDQPSVDSVDNLPLLGRGEALGEFIGVAEI